MNALPTPPPSRSPYTSSRTVGPGRLQGLSWHRVLVRLVLVLVGAQVVGALVATLLVVPIDLRAHPALAPALFWVVPAVLAGLGLGLLLPASHGLPRRLAAPAAVVGGVAYLLLVLLGRARAGEAGQPLLTAHLVGGLLSYVVLQTGVAVGVWALRLRRRGSA